MRMMFSTFRLPALMFAAAAILVGLAVGYGDDPPHAPAGATEAAEKPINDAERVSVEEARRQAKVLHTAMHASLQLMHHRYYREDAGLPIPAAVTKEVFTELADNSPVSLRWLVVEGQAMNTDHLAKSQFEKDAVKALKSGQPSVEEIGEGMYQRAGPITLTSHCLKCHVPDRKSTKDRTAGLIISIPVTTE